MSILQLKTLGEEQDILDIVKEHPSNMTENGIRPKYGVPDLAEAVEGLATIPHPWTVPKMIGLFRKETSEYLQQLQQSMTSDGWEKNERRCGCLASVLAASHDPRAAVELSHALETRNFPAYHTIIKVLYYNFLSDSRYRQLPPHKGGESFTNILWVWERDVKEWWELNENDLTSATEGKQ